MAKTILAFIIFAVLTVHPAQAAAPGAPACPCVPDQRFAVAAHLASAEEVVIAVTNSTHGHREAGLSVLVVTGDVALYADSLSISLAGGASLTTTLLIDRTDRLGALVVTTRWDEPGCAEVVRWYNRILLPVVRAGAE